ncbi:MAG: alcohol dehydrogenase [Phycisphaerae bacterium]
MATMRAMQVSKAKGDFELVERPVPTPGEGQVRIRVQACGVCHSDVFVKEGLFPGLSYPRVPGHEVVGTIDAVGPGVTRWKVGQRVGVGWHGGHCFVCDPCRRGDFIKCASEKITGLGFDGGYAEYMLVGQEGLAAVPEGLESAEAAPLLCAGVTTFNALRNSGARAGDTVAVQGVGGLGHLGVQFARAMGFRTVAISNSEAKRDLALKLGAHHYIDGSKQSPANELKKLGGAKTVLATAPDAKTMSTVIGGLAADGRLVVVGVSTDPIPVAPLQIIGKATGVVGWPSGTAFDSEDTLKFAALSGVTTMIEKYPLTKANEAFAHMMSNKARFRVVLTME